MLNEGKSEVWCRYGTSCRQVIGKVLVNYTMERSLLGSQQLREQTPVPYATLDDFLDWGIVKQMGLGRDIIEGKGWT